MKNTEQPVKIKLNLKNKPITALLAAFVIILLCELLFSAYPFFAVRGLSKQTLSVKDSLLGTNCEFTDIGISVEGKTSISFINLQCETRYVTIVAQGKKNCIASVSAYLRDGQHAIDDERCGNYSVYLKNGVSANRIAISSRDDMTKLRLELGNEWKGAVITSVILNDVGAYSPNFLRVFLIFALVAVIYLCAYYKTMSKPYEQKSHKKYVLAAILASIVITIAVSVVASKPYIYKYPLEGSVDDYPIYVQMTDALRKGQLNIDTDLDLSGLEELENPYDNSQRRIASLNGSQIWDRAYYQGNLYCYFGIAPVLLIYLPISLITGYIPTDAAAILITALFACITIPLALLQVRKKFCKSTPLPLVILGIFALTSASMVRVLQTCDTMYYIAVLFGIASLAATVACAFAAEASYGKKRKLLFALSGICLVLTVASRPNMVLFVVMLLPLFISVLLDKKQALKSRVYDAVSFAIPLVIGAVLIMLYNAARFSGPFDFGNNYQLTLSDTSAFTFEPYLLIPAIYHYFLQTPDVNGIFPFLHLRNPSLDTYRNYIYNYGTVGAFSFPAIWGTFCIPSATRGKSNKLLRYTLLSAVLCAVFMAWFDICFSGIHFRYLSDLLFPLALASVIALFVVSEKASAKSQKLGSAVNRCIALLFVLTIVLSAALVFDNEPDKIRLNCPALFDLAAGLFS